jgi:hypothetical protein
MDFLSLKFPQVSIEVLGYQASKNFEGEECAL